MHQHQKSSCRHCLILACRGNVRDQSGILHVCLLIILEHLTPAPDGATTSQADAQLRSRAGDSGALYALVAGAADQAVER